MPLEHTKTTPQPTIYEVIPFIWGFSGYAPRGMLGFFLEEGLSCGVWVVLFFLRKFSELHESFIKQQASFSVFLLLSSCMSVFFSPVRWKTSSVKSTPPNCIKPAPTAQLLLGSNASFLTEARLEVYENQKNWKVNPVQEMMNCSAAQFLARNKGHDITAEEAEEVRKICIRDEMCHLCTKGCWHDPNDQHLKSQGHCEKVKEEACAIGFSGKAECSDVWTATAVDAWANAPWEISTWRIILLTEEILHQLIW